MDERGTDRTLVARSQRGDRLAFDLLVRKYQHRVGKLVSRYLRDRGEVEDATQESFIRAWRAIGNFRGDAAFYTWLYRIAVNTAKNHLESLKRRPAELSVDSGDDENEARPPVLRDEATPERQAQANEIGETVARTLEALPEDLRTALTLREVEGLSYEEIAEVMACPVGTVRSRIFRAREAIERELKPLLEV